MFIRSSKWYCVILFFLGCEMGNFKAPNKPKNLISETQMVDVLYDMAVLNAAKNINKRNLENTGVLPTNFVFEKYKIDSLQFAQSSTYYTFKKELFARIYDSVLNRLERDKTNYEAAYAREVALKDSLASLKSVNRDSINNLKEKRRVSMSLSDRKEKIDSLRQLNLKAVDTLGLGHL